MAKSKLEIQRGWEAYLTAKQVSESLSAQTTSDLRSIFASEVECIVRVPEYETQLTARLAKYNTLLVAHDGSLAAFEPLWNYRRDFLTWMMT